ncbi:uncharacterized protein [Aristolochia californica]|uniref:uncharacterized protein n=1 Tax=Aristolochia californica TaxID=171875 RepID=UPI0035DEF391
MEVSSTLLSSTEIYQGFRSPSELSEFSMSPPEPSLSPSPSSREVYEGLMSPGWWDLTPGNDDTEDLDGGDYSSAANPRTRLELAAATNNFSDDRMQGSIGMGRIGGANFQTTDLEWTLVLNRSPQVGTGRIRSPTSDDQIVVMKVQMDELRGVSNQLLFKLQWRTIRSLFQLLTSDSRMESDHVAGGSMFSRKAMKTAAGVPGVTTVAIEGNDRNQMVITGQGIDVAQVIHVMRKKFGYAELVSVSGRRETKTGRRRM